MSVPQDTRRFMKLYPQVFFACHTRHARDPKTKQLVTARQLRIMDHLEDAGGTPLGDLARHLGVTPSTLSLTIDRLERKGYVSRKQGTADRRQVMLRLTRQGVRLRDAQTVLDLRRVRAVLKRLSKTERNSVLAGLERLVAASYEMAAETRDSAATRPATQRNLP